MHFIKKLTLIPALAALAALAGCCFFRCRAPEADAASAIPPDRARYDESAGLWIVNGRGGMVLKVAEFGGRVVSLAAPDRDGVFANVVVGFDDHCAEMREWANSIWDVEPFERPATGDAGLVLRLQSPAGENGCEGNVNVTVTYTVTPDNKWLVDYAAMTDRATHINMTQRACFNLLGKSNGDITGHWLKVDSVCYAVADEEGVSTGEVRSVVGTALDFRKARKIGERIDSECPTLFGIGGYDHIFVLKGGVTRALKPAATMWDDATGRELKVYTTEPGLHLYTGDMMELSGDGEDDGRLASRGGVALETQHFPNSANIRKFPSTVVTPNRPYESHTVYAFGIHRVR